MRQPEPCCGGLVTPTLDDLLAVARNKPLPRMKVRERRPPPVKIGASLKGWMEWRLVNRQGREVRGGEGPNLILNQGLDQIAVTEMLSYSLAGALPTYFPIIRYAAVGTDSSSPAASDAGLGAELARTATTFQAETITRPSPGVYQLTRFIEFDYSVANGNLAEWGFSSSASAGSNLFNRALFTDGDGNPDTVTKTDQEKLRLTYTLEVALSPVTLTAGSFTITGVGTVNGDYTLLGGAAPTGADSNSKAPDLALFSALARGALGGVTGANTRPDVGSIAAWPTDLSGAAYTDVVSHDNDTSAARVAREVLTPRDAYVSGSFERTGGAWRFDTPYANLSPIRGFLLTGISVSGFGSEAQQFGYAFDLDPGSEFSKDNEHTLTIGAPTVTWGRAS